MIRCLQLAEMGAGRTAPNPMVGAVLVHNGRIIGEGYHEKFGDAHAEVNCLNSVEHSYRQLISDSTLYVSLEPCSHFGKTPPCTDLMLKSKIPNVVIGCLDSFKAVNGSGVGKLKNAGVAVITGVLEKQCRHTNRRFFTFHEKQRPYIILKWAQTDNGKIGSGTGERLMISNSCSNRLVHKWRSEEAAIMVGTNTAMKDDPELTTRLWPGKNPLRIVIDKNLRLPKSLKLLKDNLPTIIFNNKEASVCGNLRYIKADPGEDILPQIMKALHKMQVQSILIEGGAKLLQTLIDSNLWDEARVIINADLTISAGVDAPAFDKSGLISSDKLLNDNISIFQNKWAG